MGYSSRATEPERLLASPVRRRILAHLRLQPPNTAGEMSRALGLRFAQANYHLRILRRAGAVACRDVGERTYYYMPGVHFQTAGSTLSPEGGSR